MTNRIRKMDQLDFSIEAILGRSSFVYGYTLNTPNNGLAGPSGW